MRVALLINADGLISCYYYVLDNTWRQFYRYIFPLTAVRLNFCDAKNSCPARVVISARVAQKSEIHFQIDTTVKTLETRVHQHFPEFG